MLVDLSPTHLRDASGGLSSLGAALHQAAMRHGVTAAAARERARHLGGAGDAPALREVEATLVSTALTIADVPAHLERAGSRACSLARTAASTATALATVERETADAIAVGRLPDLDAVARRRCAEQLEQLARRRATLLDGWQAACRTAEQVFEDAGAALAVLGQRLDATVPPDVPERLARVVVGTWRLTDDLGSLRQGLDVRAHVARLQEAQRRRGLGALERDRRAAAAAAERVGRGLRSAAAGVRRGAPSVVRQLGSRGRDAALRAVRLADERAARLSSSRLAQGVRAVGIHPTMRAVGKRLGPLGLLASTLDIGSAVADGRRTDALVGSAGLAAGGVLLLGAVAPVAAPLMVGAAVVAAGVVVYEHREQIAAAGRWVGDRVRNGLRRLRGERPRCP